MRYRYNEKELSPQRESFSTAVTIIFLGVLLNQKYIVECSLPHICL